MKATLFLAAASVRMRVGLQRTHNLAGLGPRMPLTMGAFAIGSVAMVGIPPTAGFFSKWYMAQAGVDQGQWVVVAVVLFSSLLTAVYLFKVLEQAYLRPAKPEPSAHGDDEHESSAEVPIRSADQGMRPVVRTGARGPVRRVAAARRARCCNRRSGRDSTSSSWNTSCCRGYRERHCRIRAAPGRRARSRRSGLACCAHDGPLAQPARRVGDACWDRDGGHHRRLARGDAGWAYPPDRAPRDLGRCQLAPYKHRPAS